MGNIPENQIFGLDAVHLRFDPDEHPWRVAESEAVDAHWQREQRERPWLYNGTVMLHRGLTFEHGFISGVSHRVPFAALLHWLKIRPEADVWHLFGSAVILSGDGAMLLIRMAANTANPGRVYAPAGSLDPSDITGDLVDVDGAIRREALEETGLDLTEAEAEGRLLCWRRGRMVSVFRRFRYAETAEQLVVRVREHVRTSAEQEIDDVVVVRAPADAGATAPDYMQALLAFHFDARQIGTAWQGNGIG
ncbi:NUDIX hydrolase [Hoeflea sp.]|uniref:NUDIX hydrolase n=1 Tax=Hoeflea sp. TaxID=1940281 RepID=UPI002AFE1385|nr:NUDIX hydrolase [Hoeflea sp.]